MFGVYMCLFCVCVVLCLARGLANGCSPVQGPMKGCRATKIKDKCVYSHKFGEPLPDYAAQTSVQFAHLYVVVVVCLYAGQRVTLLGVT
jgi:hypothetical protein